jgi:hypothetical protein
MDRETNQEEIKVCCLCKREFTGYGNNPLPLYNKEGRCCNLCNIMQVIPARLKLKEWKDGLNERNLP